MLGKMHKRKFFECSICGAEVPDLPMLVLQHQMSHVRRRPFATGSPPQGSSGANNRAGDGRQEMMAPTMPIDYEMTEMWQLNSDRRSVRMELPGLEIEGMPELIRVNVDFDAGVLDKMIERLTLLRQQMLPSPPARLQN